MYTKGHYANECNDENDEKKDKDDSNLRTSMLGVILD